MSFKYSLYSWLTELYQMCILQVFLPIYGLSFYIPLFYALYFGGISQHVPEY